MPCYARRTISIDFKGGDPDLVVEAMVEAGLCAAHGGNNKALAMRIIQTGKIETPDYLADKVGVMKRAYARLAVEQAARRFRWKVQKKENQLVLRR